MEPLESLGRDVDVFVATAAREGCDEWFASWRAALGPRLRAYSVARGSRSRSVGFRRSVDLAIRWNADRPPLDACNLTDSKPPATRSFKADILARNYDTVIITRPDAVWRDPRYAASLVVNAAGRARADVVYTHRCETNVWRRWQCVSDVVIAVPARVFVDSLKPYYTNRHEGHPILPAPSPPTSRIKFSKETHDSRCFQLKTQKLHAAPETAMRPARSR